jgi:HSP20 family protein
VLSGIGSFWAPATDLYETPREFFLYVDLPGVALEDVEVVVESKGIRLRGQRSSLESGCSAERLEIRTGTFDRELELPERIDVTAVSAVLKDGVLRIVLPKLEACAVAIPVQSEQES